MTFVKTKLDLEDLEPGQHLEVLVRDGEPFHNVTRSCEMEGNPVVVKEDPPEKYIQLTTVDGHDFWFMGFVNYEKASHHLLTSVSDSQTARTSASG